MENDQNPCAEGLTPECFEKYPRYAKKVFAYKLLQAVLPAPLTRKLLGMLWRHLVEIPISWIPYEDFIIPEDPPREELFPNDWLPGDPLPEGIIVEPGAEFPNDWLPGDPLPDNVTLDLEVLLPDVWTVGEDLPFGIKADPDFRLDTDMLKTLGIYVEPGKTYEAVFGTGWDPTTELPDGSSWEPYIKPDKKKGGAVPPLYLGPWEPGPGHRVSAAGGVTITQVTLFASIDCNIKNYRGTWLQTRDGLVGTGIFCNIGITTSMVQAWRGASAHQIRRYFFSVDLSTIPTGATLTKVKLQMTSYVNDLCGVSVQEGTQQAVMTKNDYSQFAGEYFAEIDWQVGVNEFLFNQTGLDFMTSKVGTMAKVCIREYDHDYLGNQPAVNNNFLCGCYGPTTGNDANKPQFIITY